MLSNPQNRFFKVFDPAVLTEQLQCMTAANLVVTNHQLACVCFSDFTSALPGMYLELSMCDAVCLVFEYAAAVGRMSHLKTGSLNLLKRLPVHLVQFKLSKPRQKTPTTHPSLQLLLSSCAHAATLH